MTSWDPPTPPHRSPPSSVPVPRLPEPRLPEPQLPEPTVSGPARRTTPPPSGSAPLSPREPRRRRRWRTVLLAVGGGLVALVALAAVFGDRDDGSLSTTGDAADESRSDRSVASDGSADESGAGSPAAAADAGMTPVPVVTSVDIDATPVTSPPPTAALVEPVGETWIATSIIDGDTLDVTGPDGSHTVRLIGINTPERGECFSGEATEALRRLADGPLVLASDVTDEDQYGRKLRFVETADGVDIGAALVRDGMAISRRYEPDVSRSEIYDRLQAEAEAAGIGLWAPDACGPRTADVSIGLEIRFDANGDDNHNKNDEWVRFTNDGDDPLNLDGWVVADESASHRYTFRDLTLAPGAAVTLFTGCGDDSATERYWCNADSAVWNNSGDTVFLRDPSGNTVLSESYAGN